MVDLVLYDAIGSGNCFKIRFFASIPNLRLTMRPIMPIEGETRTKTFARVNPLQQVPVLIDGDVKVQDSQAILVYLALKYGREWIDPTSEGMAAIHEWLSYAAKKVSNGPQMARLHFYDPQEEIDIERAQAIGRNVLRFLNRILADRDWRCLARPTIAAIAVFPYVAISKEGRLPLDQHHNVVAWIDHIPTIPGYEPMPGMSSPLLPQNKRSQDA
ncbi:glutathione S-transferase family protein [Paracoccus saliphilus]|uniref:Glutathione S-transferase n=1 Tax=Paracoccus saliphilus TaxID=405559 RepID=A0AA45W2M9_9RHOB|nr:glutathione S-transferase N-terminal domain-containing protein [Paracoccus saliphilus]WCR01443.1 glutathione S-transferase N-terminal domain-containing protein [Paracoccus saliphilus]SIS69373.1 glutathione S-transferase [Paracoccus saliphilus]